MSVASAVRRTADWFVRSQDDEVRQAVQAVMRMIDPSGSITTKPGKWAVDMEERVLYYNRRFAGRPLGEQEYMYLTFHEGGHLLHSEKLQTPSWVTKPKAYHKVWNACEDLRMERCMMRQFPGFAAIRNTVGGKMLQESASVQQQDIMRKRDAFKASFLSAFWNEYSGVWATPGLRSRTDPYNWGYHLGIEDVLRATNPLFRKAAEASSMKRMMRYVDEIYRILFEQQDEPEPDDDEDGDTEGEGGESDQDEGDSTEGDDSDTEQPEQDDEGEGEGEGDSDDAEGDEDTESEDTEGEQGDTEGDDDEDSEDGESEGESESEGTEDDDTEGEDAEGGDDADGEDSDDTEGDDADGDEGEGEGEQPDDSDTEGEGGTEDEGTPEPEQDEQDEDEDTEGAESEDADDEPVNIFDDDEEFEQPPADDEESEAESGAWRKFVLAGAANRFSVVMRSMLRKNDQRGKKRNLAFGKLDLQRYYRMDSPIYDFNVFTRRVDPDKPLYALIISVDTSGSMITPMYGSVNASGGTPLTWECALEAAATLAEAWNQLRLPWTIFGWGSRVNYVVNESSPGWQLDIVTLRGTNGGGTEEHVAITQALDLAMRYATLGFQPIWFHISDGDAQTTDQDGIDKFVSTFGGEHLYFIGMNVGRRNGGMFPNFVTVSDADDLYAYMKGTIRSQVYRSVR